MSHDIFDFWSPSSIADDDHIHPADRDILARTRHHLQTDCRPAAFRGALRTAPVVLLFLSPGYDNGFDSEHAATAEGRAYYRRQRNGDAALPDRIEHRPAYQWHKRILSQFSLSPEVAAPSVSILNLGAYHSKTFSDFHLLTALPSARVSADHAQFTLFPQAEAGQRVVICLRAHRFWGLGAGLRYGVSLFAPNTTPGGRMYKKNLADAKLAREIVETVYSALSLQPSGKAKAGTSPA